MTARFPADKPEKLRGLLTGLRDSPKELDGLDVRDVLAWAMAQPPAEDGLYHWYCHRAGELLHMASVYLLCMFSYQNNEKYKDRLGLTQSGCCDCQYRGAPNQSQRKENHYAVVSVDTIQVPIPVHLYAANYCRATTTRKFVVGLASSRFQRSDLCWLETDPGCQRDRDI